jgi:hypothetical protein
MNMLQECVQAAVLDLERAERRGRFPPGFLVCFGGLVEYARRWGIDDALPALPPVLSDLLRNEPTWVESDAELRMVNAALVHWRVTGAKVLPSRSFRRRLHVQVGRHEKQCR